MKMRAAMMTGLMLVAAVASLMVRTEAQTPHRGGTITVGLNAPVTNIDPHTNPNQPASWLDQLVYSYLVQLSPSLQIMPDVATSWTQPDNRTYVFKLRTDAKFSNGRPVTSADAKYSLERIVDPKTGSARAALFANIDSIDTPDATTVIIHLKAPDDVLLSNLADPAAAIVASEVVKAQGNLQQVSAGSGPFMVKQLTPDGGAVLVRNPYYYDRNRPYLDSVVLRAIPDITARMTAVRTGDADLVTFLVTNQIDLLKKDATVHVTDGLSGQYYFLALNLKQKPFDDVKVRQAMAWAVNRTQMVRGALSDAGVPLNAGPIPAWDWAGIKTPIYQPTVSKAKALLAESSVPRGFTFAIRVWSSQDYVVDTAELIQAQLAPLGIQVTIDQQGDWPTYWNPVARGDYQTTIQGFGGNVDPDNWLYERFHTGGGSNITGYSNSTVDNLLERARVAPSQARRIELYDQVQRIIATDAPMLFLYNMKQAEAYRLSVHGYYHMPNLTLIGLKDTWIEK